MRARFWRNTNNGGYSRSVFDRPLLLQMDRSLQDDRLQPAAGAGDNPRAWETLRFLMRQHPDDLALDIVDFLLAQVNPRYDKCAES